MDPLFYMELARREALLAYEAGDVPVGCVIVYRDEVIGRGRNRRNERKNALCHAELLAVDQACGYMRDWRLEDCDAYVTVEPCPMCAGALLQARVRRLYFGAKNPKAGAVGSVVDLLGMDGFNHRVEVVSGVMEEECRELMQRFFRERRVTPGPSA